MTKAIIINKCAECPFINPHYYDCDDEPGACTHDLIKDIMITDEDIIDEKCPLEDYKLKNEPMTISGTFDRGVIMSLDPQIRLTEQEMIHAGTIGIHRAARDIARGCAQRRGIKINDSWWANIEGALGECALAKYLNLYWNDSPDPRPGDVGKLEVRTRSSHYYDLMVHKSDPDNAIFWLLTGWFGEYRVRGWVKAGDVKKEKYWKDHAGNRATYFVPKEVLNSPLNIEWMTQLKYKIPYHSISVVADFDLKKKKG